MDSWPRLLEYDDTTILQGKFRYYIHDSLGFTTFSCTKPCAETLSIHFFEKAQSWGVARLGGWWHQEWRHNLWNATRHDPFICFPALPRRSGRNVNPVEVVLSQVIAEKKGPWIIHWEGDDQNDPCRSVHGGTIHSNSFSLREVFEFLGTMNCSGWFLGYQMFSSAIVYKSPV